MKHAFSVVEFLVAIALLAALGALALNRMAGASPQSRWEDTRANLQRLKNAVTLYSLHTGTYPGALEDLLHKQEVMGWKGPYVRQEQLKDSWGRAYVYRAPGDEGRAYEISSLGADGKVSEDDLRSWSPKLQLLAKDQNLVHP